MKKFLVLILAIIMVLSVVACKNEPEKGAEMPVEKDKGKEALIEQGADHGKALDYTGFVIGVSVDEGVGQAMTIEIGGRNGIYWYDANVEGVPATLITEHEGATYCYVSALGYWLKVADISLKEKLFDSAVDALLYSAYNYLDSLNYVGTETKFNRPCSKYTVSATEEGVKYSFSIWVDQEFGITMGMEAAEGAQSITFSINPKLSNVSDADTPAVYATGKACTTYKDQIEL